MAAPAFAQAADDEVIVTGSRVARKNLEAPSPVTSVTAEELSIVNTVNTEEFINTLPQAIPGFDSTSNNPGNGTATVNLRGLGSQRTLVLVDGQRYVSANGNGVVDLNSIPAALVKRVDVVTGGASAVYGSDAMSGVVNFILEDSFEGAELSATYQITEKGDGAKKNASLTLGGNFDNGRGNATVFAAYSQRDEVFQGDRDFAFTANGDNGAGANPGFSPFGSAGVPGSRFFDNNFNFTQLGFDGVPTPVIGTTPLVLPNGDPNGFGVTNSCGTNGGRLRDPDGSLAFDAATNPTQTISGDEFCGGNVTFDTNGEIIPWINSGANTTRYNYAPVNYLQLPQERYTLAAFGRYDITDTVELKLRSIFTSNIVPQELAPTPFFSTVTIDATTNPFLSQSERDTFTAAAVAGGQDPTAYALFIGRRMLEVGPRNADQELQSMQISADLGGEFGFGWDWDVHSHISRTSGSFVQTGNVSISAMQAAVQSGTCNIFGQGAFSQACVGLVARTGIIQSVSEQRNIVATTGGAIEAFKSPMADSPMQTVMGIEYKEDSFDFRPDSVLGPDVSGFNQSLPVAGTTDSYEAFGEVFLPLIEGQQFFDELSVNGAYRYTDHSNAGGFSSYAAGVEWAPTSQIRFRGQYQRAVRAPNVVELFSPQTNGFPGAQDPCSSNVANALVGATGIQSICVAQGVPSGLFNTQFQANGQIQGLFGGNPNLTAESSDTLTFGAVIQPDFIEGLTLTVDWYDIDIDDAISTIPVQAVLDGCYLGTTPQFCANVIRNPSGLINNIQLTNQNIAFLGAQGVDFQVDYKFDAEKIGMGGFGGEFDFQVIGSYALSNEGQGLPVLPVDDCVGFHGGNGGQCGEPVPELKTTTRLTYSNGPASVTTRWRHLSSTFADDFHPNAGVTPNLFAPETGSVNYFDVTGTWDVSDTVQLSGGVLNLTDLDPPELGSCCSQQANTWPATYRTLGRQFYMGGKLRF